MATVVLEPRPMLHSRATSHESMSSSNSAHRQMFESMLEYPSTYELPLRTMYALNSVCHTTLPQPGNQSPEQLTPLGPADAAHKLELSIMVEMSQMPHQPASLPATFITSFVRKCFASELMLVDFPQTLTGLDYLKDLEIRRTRELKAALTRLEIDVDNCDQAERMLVLRYPAAAKWYAAVADKLQQVEALYTQLYIALRRWILINELSLTPFSKHGCVAMLNTVYPPVLSTQPTARLTPGVLKSQRDVFFKWIQTVEKNGAGDLENLITHGRRAGDETGWPSVRELLDKYLDLCNELIDECLEIVPIRDAGKVPAGVVRRKADSGIDFAGSRKSSTSGSESSVGSVTELERPSSRATLKSSTALEKIAREFRHMRRMKTDISEILPPATEVEQAQSENKTLRKMKSFGSLTLRRQASRVGLVSTPKMPEYDLAKMTEQRKAYDASTTNVAFRLRLPQPTITNVCL